MMAEYSPGRERQIHAPEASSEHGQTDANPLSKRSSELLANVLETADNTVIFTVLPPGGVPVRIEGKPAQAELGGGFQEIGDIKEIKSAPYFGQLEREARATFNEPPGEVVAFVSESTPIMETRDEIQKGRFGRKKTVSVPKYVGEEPVQMINRITGDPEPAERIDYRYLTSSTAVRQEGLPDYDSPEGRPGNILNVQFTLPASIAKEVEITILGDSEPDDELKDKRKPDPAFIRSTVEQIVIQRGGISKEIWDGTDQFPNPVSPPYKHLPPNWEINVVKYPDDADPNLPQAQRKIQVTPIPVNPVPNEKPLE